MTTTINPNSVSAPRRGSVLIFALAILAVLALLGATYVTRANLDRVSAEAAVRRSTLSQQPEIVVDHIRALVAADLFGNKLVTKGTPRTVDGRDLDLVSGSATGDIDIWPAMFEDGEHWDYPSVDEVQYNIVTSGHADRYTFARAAAANDSVVDEPARVEARLRYDPALRAFETARPDDAWLASSEPVDHLGNEPLGSYDGEWNTWPQITNPRSAYRWRDDVDDSDGATRGAWVRGDGRFADLALFFNSGDALTRGRGDPSADLLDRANDQRPFYRPSDFANSLLPLNRDYNSALLGVEQRNVYAYQMNQMAEWYELGPSFDPDATDADYEPVDERFWADTDGDGRPDARWSVLDELDGQGGMRWVVAMRIADSSAAVNVNTAIEGLPAPPSLGVFDEHQVYGDGATPVDVDLLKLFQESSTTAGANSASGNAATDLRHPDVRGIDNAFVRTGLRRHFLSGLGLDENMVDDGPSSFRTYYDANENTGVRAFVGWTDDDDRFAYSNDTTDFPTTRAQREAYWRLFASRPDSPLVRGGRRYDLKEEVELRASQGVNFAGVKTLESNFDGAYIPADSRLPGALANPYPDRDSLGPMRSAEHSNAVVRDDLMNVDLPEFTAGTYSQAQRIERIQKDVRRSLTVASGASARSVVPAIGEREVDPGRLKPLVNAGVWDERRFTPSLSVEDAFEAFTWALAPLATNRPLMGALHAAGQPNNWITRYNANYSVNPDFHYGGGARGPARAWASDMSRDLLATLDPNSMGPTYALFRAASLAVNLRDAVDNEADVATPTVARLLTAPDLVNEPTTDNLDGAVKLTTRFAHGDIDNADPNQAATPGSQVVPNAFIQPENGVTFVGLDRQPFISEAFALCMYQANYPIIFNGDPPPNTIDFSLASSTTSHAIVAVELINPWDTDVSMVDYQLMLTDGTNVFAADVGVATIPAGERFVVIMHNTDDDANARRSVDALEDYLAGLPLSVLSVPAPTDDEIDNAFASWTTNATSVLLYRTIGSSQLLVDRLANPGDDNFPYTNEDLMLATAEVDAIDDAAESYGAWYTVGSNLSRRSDAPAPGGFPFTVLERPDFNEVHQADSDPNNGAEGWHDSEPGRSHFEIFRTDTVTGSAEAFTLGDDNVTSAADTPPRPFSLFVPDAPLIAKSELGMISAFAHTYIHDSSSPPTVTAADANTQTSRWATVSEQLAKHYHLNYDATLATVPTADDQANPYLAVLDPTRFTLGQNGDLRGNSSNQLPALPDALAVPLALRVYDAFEVLADAVSPREALVAGRVNINTAPKRVLATLPLVLPVDYADGDMPEELNDSGQDLFEQSAYGRLNAMVQYRERLGANWSQDPFNLRWNNWDYDSRTGMLGGAVNGFGGVRELYNANGAALSGAAAPGVNDHRKGRGFSSLGELSILANWISGSTVAPTPSQTADARGFLELANDGNDNTMELNERNALDVRRHPVGIAGAPVIPAEAIDDVEERLALFRAVSNIAATRSDVYHAWYIARAYSPAAIEAVEISPMLSDENERAELLNNLPVAFEERGLVILDRSDVREPTDRPRVLLRVVLDSTTSVN